MHSCRIFVVFLVIFMSFDRVRNTQDDSISAATVSILDIRNNKIICQGVAITTLHVITASSCVYSRTTDFKSEVMLQSKTNLRVGVYDEGLATIYKVSQLSPHPLYDSHSVASNSHSVFYNIAIVKVQEEMSGVPVVTLPITDFIFEDYTNSYRMGFGYDENKDSIPLYKLQTVIMPNERCINYFVNSDYQEVADSIFSHSSFCTEDKFTNVTSLSNLGSPLVVHESLYGILFFEKEGFPFIFTSIYEYSEFIINCVNHDDCKEAEKVEWEKLRAMPPKPRSHSYRQPGANYCGPGDTAPTLGEVEYFYELDYCCMEHERCPWTIPSKTTRYGIYNPRKFTMLFCGCEQIFHKCLQRVNQSVVSEVYDTAMYFIDSYFADTDCFDFNRKVLCSQDVIH